MVQGLDRLKRKLTVTIPARVRDRTRKAMEKGANELVAMMKNLAPVDDGAPAGQRLEETRHEANIGSLPCNCLSS